MLEVVLTREDANSDSALLAEWHVDDRAHVRKGHVLCVVETSKASIEILSPGNGTLVQLVSAGVEIDLGSRIALVAESADELAEAEVTNAAQAIPAKAPDRSAARNATRKAIDLAERLGFDLAQIDKVGFITAEDVKAAAAATQAPPRAERDPVLAGLSTSNVTLPAVFGVDEGDGVLDEGFLASLRADLDAFAWLSSDEKCDAYRRHGAQIGTGVTLGAGAAIVAPRIVLEDRVTVGDGARIQCAEVFAAGELALLGESFQLACRRAFIGAGTWTATRITIGGGGHRDPWATFAIGESGFIGDEVFINVCRPVLIGAEAFVTMRSVLLTHNIGHSLLDGFENRFAGIVLEDRVQIGVGAIVYPGCRIGREAVVASNSYVVSDIPARMLAIGVPARATGRTSRDLARPGQAALARKMIDELEELLVLRGIELEPVHEGDVHGVELVGAEGPARIVFVETLDAGFTPAGDGETVVLTLELAGAAPEGCAVLDLAGRRVFGGGGVVLDSAREFCRKRGIRFDPGPWKYSRGLV